MNFEFLPPLSLYIHIPWCVRKCPYCDFNSHEGVYDEDAYVSALVRDLESSLPDIWGRRISSVFFGGGTPSLMSPGAIEAILTRAQTLLRFDPVIEVTLEANPGTFEREKFASFRQAGISRLSVGIQSFEDRHLERLGRIHDSMQALAAVETALALFGNVNLDLMYALPGQTPDEAESDFSKAMSFDPHHVSAYHLTIEPNTYFHKHPPEIPDEDESFEMQCLIEDMLGRSYRHYETSAFAKEGLECRHNLNYWEYGDYVGIGAGAHSKISKPEGIFRQMRFRNPKEYMARALSGDPVQTRNEVHHHDIAFEFMMNALRLNDGFPLSLFEERTGLSRASILSRLDEAERLGYVSMDTSKVTPTLQGKRFLNDLLQIFLP